MQIHAKNEVPLFFLAMGYEKGPSNSFRTITTCFVLSQKDLWPSSSKFNMNPDGILCV